MADKEIHVTNSGGGGMTALAAIIAVVLVGLALVYFFGVFDGDKKVMDVNIDAPKIDLPKVDAPKVDVPGVGDGN